MKMTHDPKPLLFCGGNFRMKSSCMKAQSPRVTLVKCSDSLNAA